MRQPILKAAATTALGLFASMAHAQSSVTLYGIVDAGIAYNSNQGGHSIVYAATGNQFGDRWGLKGNEDLGGGMHAIFRLENGFNIYSGASSQGGREFGRHAEVGLADDKLGTVTLGRQYNAAQDYLADMQIGLFTAAYALHPYDTDDLNNTFRTGNSIKYVSPTISGLQGTAMYAFSNSTDFSSDRAWDVGLRYSHGLLNLAAVYVSMDHPGLNTTGAVNSDNYYAASFVTNVQRQQIWGAGGTYAIGNTTLSAMYTNTSFSLLTGSERFANYDVSARYQLTPFVLLAAGETYTTASDPKGAQKSAHYWQTNAGVSYFLSKSTILYLDGFYQRASGAVAFIETASAAASGHSQLLVVSGIRHNF